MNLIVLTQYYPPESGAPQRRLSELARVLAAQGHRVTVLTAMPSYPKGRIFAGYGGLVRRETIDGVSIIRTFIYPTQKAALVPRLLNYFSFVFSSSIIGAFLLKRADFLLVESPPLFLGISAVWLSWLKRARLIFNVSDLWPDSAVWMGVIRKNSLSYRMSAWLESALYRRAWLVTGQTQDIVTDIAARFPEIETSLLTNGVNIAQFGSGKATDDSRKQLTPHSDQCVVLYAGLHGLAQGLHQIIYTADKMRSDPQVQFVLIGDGPEKQRLINMAIELGLDNVDIQQSRPATEIPGLLASADILLVMLSKDIPSAAPSKMYEAMASQKPVVFVGKGIGAEIIRKHDAGLVVEPENINELVQVIQRLCSDRELRSRLGQNGRLAVENDFDREKIAIRFMDRLLIDGTGD